MEHTWLVHQMMTTSNFAPRNRLLSWYVGGLTYQIEHHLFPKVCSVHYPAIGRIVRQAAYAHGVPYHEQPTLLRAIRSHYRMLKQFGQDGGPRAAPMKLSKGSDHGKDEDQGSAGVRSDLSPMPRS
jgi:linoleoyl-CoA desaturase